MANPTWTKRASAIERAENKIAHAIAIVRAVEVLAELATTDEERDALLLILHATIRLREQAQEERRRA
jgi:hypothetical protein